MKYVSLYESELERYIYDNEALPSQLLLINGPSGCGKTMMVRGCMNHIYEKNKHKFMVYIDVTNDEYESSDILKKLLMECILERHHSFQSITNIRKDLALNSHIETLARKNKIYMSILNKLTSTAGLLPYAGSIAESVLESINTAVKGSFDTISCEKILTDYFYTIGKKNRIVIIIDNIQFLPEFYRNLIIQIFSPIKKGLDLIILERIKENSICSLSYKSLDDFKKKQFNMQYIDIKNYNYLLSKQNVEIDKEERETIYKITRGNLKEIDLILKKIEFDPSYNIIESSIAIKKLEDIQKYILIVAALFPAGMREKQVIRILQNLLNNPVEAELKSNLESLIQLGYIYKNSYSKDLVKPTHETIINNIKDAIDLNDMYYVRKCCEKSLHDILFEEKGKKNYGYLLHCLIGIMNSDELLNNFVYIEELVNLQFKLNAYYYISSLYSEVKNIIVYLSDNVIEKFLISFQRVSAFDKGVLMIKELELKNQVSYEKFKIYYVKYMIQMYNFTDAYLLIKEMPLTSETLLCKLNVLQHLGEDTEVQRLLDTELPHVNHDEYYYIILRNTTHFYSYEKAKQNLLEALEYFDKDFSDFAYATVLNNMGVIDIYSNNLLEGKKSLNQSLVILQELKSNEQFEPLCNLSILHILENRFEDANTCLELALNFCPKQLHLDILMLKVNKLILYYLQGKQNLFEVFIEFEKLIDDYPVIDDPWYKFHLLFNRNSIACALNQNEIIMRKNVKRYFLEYENELTKFHILREIKGVNFCLALSPNWRY